MLLGTLSNENDNGSAENVTKKNEFVFFQT